MEPGRIPNRLKKYRRLARLTQQEVASVIKLQNRNALSRWERGIGSPGIIHLLRLSFLYKTLPNHLYFDLYQTVKKEVATAEHDLLAQEELFDISPPCL